MSRWSTIKSRITASRPVGWAVRKSKTLSLPGFEQVSPFDMFRKFVEQLKEDNIIERASAISYNFFMAIPPTMIFLFSLLPLFHIDQSVKDEISSLITNIIPEQRNYRPILKFIDNVMEHRRTDLLSFGVLLSLFFYSNAIMGLMRTFDKDFQGFVKRKGLQKRGNALKVTLVLDFLFVICIALLEAQGKVLEWIGIKEEWLKNLIGYTRWVLIILLFLTIVSDIYRAVLSVNKKWPWITPGSVIATFFMMVLAAGFSWWVSSFGNFNKLYGSLGTVLIVLIYIFVNSLILLVGFEINVSIRDITLKREAQKNNVFMEDVLI